MRSSRKVSIKPSDTIEEGFCRDSHYFPLLAMLLSIFQNDPGGWTKPQLWKMHQILVLDQR